MNNLQKRILDIFVEVKKVCEDNDIPYYAIGGTCIGAARHKGFIPWDDDMDIAIPIEKFEYFQEIARKSLPSYLQVYTCNETKHYCNIFIKVVDTRTTFIEESDLNDVDNYCGVFVDIMPLAGFPSSKLGQIIHSDIIRLISYFNYAIRYDDEKEKGLHFVILEKIAKLLHGNIKFNYYSDKWYKFIGRYPVKSSKYVGYAWSQTKIPKNIFEYSNFDGSVNLPFETTEIACPKEYDKYLTKQFGDYMKMPKENEQYTGHEGFVDLNTPYQQYVEKGGVK